MTKPFLTNLLNLPKKTNIHSSFIIFNSPKIITFVMDYEY